MANHKFLGSRPGIHGLLQKCPEFQFSSRYRHTHSMTRTGYQNHSSHQYQEQAQQCLYLYRHIKNPLKLLQKTLCIIHFAIKYIKSL